MKNKEARKILRRAYNNLARSINAATDLELLFDKKKDKRAKKTMQAASLIMRAQEILNPLAEDEDIDLI